MFDLVGREEAGAVHRLLAHEHRRQHGREALLHEPVERVAVERELEQREVADAVREARARDLRRALHVDPAERLREVEVVLRPGSRTTGGSPDAPDLDRVLVGEAVGRVLGRRVRHAARADPRAAPRPPRARSSSLLQLVLHLLELLELLRRRLALQLRLRAQLLDARLHVEHARGRRRAARRTASAAPLRASAAPERVRVACGLRGGRSRAGV